MLTRTRIPVLVFTTLTAVYLYAFPSATIPYLVVVLAHIVAGLGLAIIVTPLVFRSRSMPFLSRAGWFAIAAGAAIGIALLFTGGSRRFTPAIYTHLIVSAAGVILILSNRKPMRLVLVFVGALALSGSAWTLRGTWQTSHKIQNPQMPPESQDYEGDGVKGAFFPSSAQTSTGGKIPSKFFMDSQACQRCHPDIYEQWTSSAHRFSSFNNQWYRKSIEYMQDVAGVESSKWCAGCHDPALLFSGMFDTPVRQLIDKPEAHAGLGCVMCHSVSAVKSTMGQGDYTLEYPRLAELAASPNKIVQALHDFLVHVNPEPHRRTFMKPFVRNQTADFCSSCHKVHLDTHVNDYRWIRGFNDYDNWQASGVSGMGARSFYYPPKTARCVDCHMPMLDSTDAGNVNGKIHSHRFPGANTALPTANRDAKQLEAVTKFLQDKIVSVDIFGLSPARNPRASDAALGATELATTFAVGEEGDARIANADAELAPLTAPLDGEDAGVLPGEAYRVDVVVRTRKIGHFFPGGTVDAFDVWLELKATDDEGKVIFWSGMVEDGGKGPVEKGAHFYRSLQLDANGNPINKRNAWATRSLAYVRLIPPGAADTAHFRLLIPQNAKGRISLKAQLNYRKFAWWNTQFSYAGERAPGTPAAVRDHDDGRWIFTGDTSKVSGQIKDIPDLPIITLAEDTATLKIAAPKSGPPERHIKLQKSDWERWNDYGIGLLLQGDLKGAEAAFTHATEVSPENPDGWVNIGRARVQEGNLSGARQVLERALSLSPDLARAHFFYSRVLRAEGAYDDALVHLRRVIAQYPKDRVVRNDTGRILFLQKKYAEAIKEFEYVLTIDPEDLQAHYNLMLCYNGLGQQERALEHQKRYLRFKADESAQSITGPFRLAHPEDNNERQAIHEHVSAVRERAGGN
jgi:tetratricopeptide (TPR) repeat protein